MSDNFNNDADALFATKRKKLQEEQAQRAALKAEEERRAELEMQKQQVAEEIKRLEALQAQQKEQEEKRALEELRAREEQKIREEQKAFEESRVREASKTKNTTEKGSFNIKKYIPFIAIGAAVILIAVILIIVLSKGSKISKYLSVEADTGFFKMDASLFGLSYEDFKDKIGMDDIDKPEAWEWWGKDLEVVFVGDGKETFACFFQYDRLVTVYRDSATEQKGKMYDSAVSAYGTPVYESDSSEDPEYLWRLADCFYLQQVETYSENDKHYRQQYIALDYTE